jgi:hypothetical protein
VVARPGGCAPLRLPASIAWRVSIGIPAHLPARLPACRPLPPEGTTGRPKGVPLTHGNLAASCVNIQGTYDLCTSDVSYLVMPLFHVHGLLAGTGPEAAGAAASWREGMNDRQTDRVLSTAPVAGGTMMGDDGKSNLFGLYVLGG